MLLNGPSPYVFSPLPLTTPMGVGFILPSAQMKDTVVAAFDSGLTYNFSPPQMPLNWKLQKANLSSSWSSNPQWAQGWGQSSGSKNIFE